MNYCKYEVVPVKTFTTDHSEVIVYSRVVTPAEAKEIDECVMRSIAEVLIDHWKATGEVLW